jgi:hypothetical protein
MTRKEIVQKVYDAIHGRFSPLDEKRVEKGELRWKAWTNYAISSLKLRGLIDTMGKNQYVITDAGRKYLHEDARAITLKPRSITLAVSSKPPVAVR